MKVNTSLITLVTRADKKMAQWTKLSLAHRRKHNYVDLAMVEAYKSPLKMKHGCIIVKHGKVISRGHNHYQITPVSGIWSTHAEVDALNNLADKSQLRGADMYVIRLNLSPHDRSIRVRYSQPCHECRKKLIKCMEKYGLRNVYYSTEM